MDLVWPGVPVVVKGTTIGTATDVDGAFTLSVPNDAATLVISFIGMKTVELPIGSQTTFNVLLNLILLHSKMLLLQHSVSRGRQKHLPMLHRMLTPQHLLKQGQSTRLTALVVGLPVFQSQLPVQVLVLLQRFSSEVTVQSPEAVSLFM